MNKIVEGDFGHNSGDEAMTLERAVEAALPAIEEIENNQAKIDKIMAKAKEECGPHRDVIAENKKHVKSEYGIEA